MPRLPLAALAAAAFASTATAEIIVDDFSSGAFVESITSGTTLRTDAGSMLSGERFTSLTVSDNPFGLALTADVSNGRLAYAAGSDLEGELGLAWGDLTTDGLDLDVTGESSLDVELLGTDAMLTLELKLYSVDGGGSVSVATSKLFLSPGDTLASFDLGSLGGDPVDLSSLDGVGLILSDGGTPEGLDFMIDRVAFVPGPGGLALLGLAGLVARGRRRHG